MNSQQTIRRIDLTSGMVTRAAGTGNQLQIQTGVPALQADLRNVIAAWADGAGNLFFTDFNGHRVCKIDAAGLLTRAHGARGWVEVAQVLFLAVE